MDETAIDVAGSAVNPWGIALGVAAAVVVVVGAAVGLYVDARRRSPRAEALSWAIGALVLPPLALPLYLLRAYYRPDTPGPPLVLPWVRSLNYLSVTIWAVLLPMIAMVGVIGVLALVVGDEVVEDLVLVLAIQGLTVGAFVIAWTYAVRFLVDRRTPRSLGTPLTLADAVGRQLLGVGCGAGAITLLLGTMWATGHAEIAFTPSAPGALQIALLLVPLYAAAFMEEVVMRGYLQRTLYASWGHVPAVLGSALAFSLLHVGNPHLSVIGLLNIGLIGVFFSLTVIRTGTLWFAAGCHWAWNLALGPVVALPVSGIEFRGLFRTRLHGPDWLTGGEFGLEGSVLATAVFGSLVVAAGGLCVIRSRFDEPGDEVAARPLPRLPSGDSDGGG